MGKSGQDGKKLRADHAILKILMVWDSPQLDDFITNIKIDHVV